MNFWKILRWTGALLFVALVLLAWVLADRGGLSDAGIRAVPVIVR